MFVTFIRLISSNCIRNIRQSESTIYLLLFTVTTTWNWIEYFSFSQRDWFKRVIAIRNGTKMNIKCPKKTGLIRHKVWRCLTSVPLPEKRSWCYRSDNNEKVASAGDVILLEKHNLYQKISTLSSMTKCPMIPQKFRQKVDKNSSKIITKVNWKLEVNKLDLYVD